MAEKDPLEFLIYGTDFFNSVSIRSLSLYAKQNFIRKAMDSDQTEVPIMQLQGQIIFMNNNGNGFHYCVDMDIKGFFDNVNHGKLLKQMWTLGIREKKLLSIISVLLKAEIEGEGTPNKGTPQGGILSPLLANIVLNELDWWISNQWETVHTKYKYSNKRHTKRALEKKNLKRCYMVRYADDFKILCKDYPTAIKMFYATKDFIETRLKLQLSPEKSKVINLRKRKSEFLGIQMYVKPKRNRYVAYSRMTEKARKNAYSKLCKSIKKMEKEPTAKSVKEYNSVVMGIHNYYEVATHVTKDLSHMSNNITRVLYNRLRRDWTPASKSDLEGKIRERYGKYNPKWYKAHDVVIIPIYAWRHKYAIQINPKICPYTVEGRMLIHENLKTVRKEMLRSIMKKYDRSRTIEFNDNCISRFVAQAGKCGITCAELDLNNTVCRHIIPKDKGGTDKYGNIIIISKEASDIIDGGRKREFIELLNYLKVTGSRRTKCMRMFNMHN